MTDFHFLSKSVLDSAISDHARTIARFAVFPESAKWPITANTTINSAAQMCHVAVSAYAKDTLPAYPVISHHASDAVGLLCDWLTSGAIWDRSSAASTAISEWADWAGTRTGSVDFLISHMHDMSHRLAVFASKECNSSLSPEEPAPEKPPMPTSLLQPISLVAPVYQKHGIAPSSKIDFALAMRTPNGTLPMPCSYRSGYAMMDFIFLSMELNELFDGPAEPELSRSLGLPAEVSRAAAAMELHKVTDRVPYMLSPHITQIDMIVMDSMYVRSFAEIPISDPKAKDHILGFIEKSDI